MNNFNEDARKTLMNFWWSMNRTTDIYMMTREQYRAQWDMGGPPDQYLQHYVGSEGNITVMTESGSIDYDSPCTPATAEFGWRNMASQSTVGSR